MSGIEGNELHTNLGFNMRSCLKKIMANWMNKVIIIIAGEGP